MVLLLIVYESVFYFHSLILVYEWIRGFVKTKQ